MVAEDMVESMVGTTDRVALVCDRDTVIAASGPDTAFAVGKTVGRAVEKAMIERQVLLVHYRGGGDASSILAENDEDLPIVSAAIAPIIVEGDPLGAVVMGTTSSEHTVGDLEEKLVTTAAGYMARQVN
ncbi:MAG: hypothetical protein NUW23_09845 [Firmicutes bacterium]|nr:hypothetical protein [Bacillota bacterium]